METIREQMAMASQIIQEICEEHGFRKPTNVWTTDFLITYKDGSKVAYSIKSDRSEFDPDSDKNRNHPRKYNKLLIRQFVEKEYWERHGVEFRIVFRNELNRVLSGNIAICLSFYNPMYVTDAESMMKCLIAHKVIRVPMDKEAVPFAKEVKGRETEIREIFERWCNDEEYRVNEDFSRQHSHV